MISPMLANITTLRFRSLGTTLANAAAAGEVIVVRYADDAVLGSNIERMRSGSSRLAGALAEVRAGITSG